MKKAVARDAALVSHNDADLPLTVSNEEKERDLGVHEYTRAQRQQRAQQASQEDRNTGVRVDPPEEELEEGEVPLHLLQHNTLRK